MVNSEVIINLLGRSLLGFYFLKAGVNNALNWRRVVGVIKSKNIPFPSVVLLLVIITQILGPLAIIFNFYAMLAAIALIIFTLCANFLLCNYWSMEGVQKKHVSFVFYANIAIVGALLLLSIYH